MYAHEKPLADSGDFGSLNGSTILEVATMEDEVGGGGGRFRDKVIADSMTSEARDEAMLEAREEDMEEDR